MKYRVGDEVTVKGTVSSICADQVGITFHSKGGEYFANTDQIVTHTSRAILVGDMVTCEGAPCAHAVLAVAGKYAWVDLPGSPTTMQTKYLTPTDPPSC